MITFLLTFLSPVTLYAMAAAIGAGFLAWVRHTGVKSERARVAKQELRARDISDEIDDAVAGRTGTENRKELKRW